MYSAFEIALGTRPDYFLQFNHIRVNLLSYDSKPTENECDTTEVMKNSLDGRFEKYSSSFLKKAPSFEAREAHRY